MAPRKTPRLQRATEYTGVGSHALVVEMRGLPWPRDLLELRGVTPLFHRRLVRALSAPSGPPVVDVAEVFMDGPARSGYLGPLRPVFPEWAAVGRTVGVLIHFAESSGPAERLRLRAAAEWGPDLYVAAARRVPGLDELDFAESMPVMDGPEDEMQFGVELEWEGTAWPGGAEGPVAAAASAVARVAEVLRHESRGAFEQAVALEGDDEASHIWLQAGDLAGLDPGERRRRVLRLAGGLRSLLHGAGGAVRAEPEADRLAEALSGVGVLAAARASELWPAVRAWGEREGATPEEVAYAGLLGRATEAAVGDPFMGGFLGGAPERATTHVLYEALQRAWAAFLAWEDDPVAAGARWRELLDIEGD